MTAYEALALIVGIIALTVSYLSYRNSKAQRMVSEQLSAREVELVRRQISAFDQEEREKLQADISARMVDVGKGNWRLRIFNRGKGEAYDVRIGSADEDGEDGIVSRALTEDTFPMEVMEPGQSVDVSVAVHLGTKRKDKVTLSWRNKTGREGSNKVLLTL